MLCTRCGGPVTFADTFCPVCKLPFTAGRRLHFASPPDSSPERSNVPVPDSPFFKPWPFWHKPYMQFGWQASSSEDRPLRLFYSYAPEDEGMCAQLDSHLALLRREGTISRWNRRCVSPGEDLQSAIREQLQEADIVISLVSADYLASDCCYEAEMRHALSLKKSVLPIILRPCDWRHGLFEELYALPRGGVPITSWSNVDEGWADVARALRAACHFQRGQSMASDEERMYCPSHEGRFYVYLSESKIDMLFRQLSPQIVARVAGTCGISQESLADQDYRPFARAELIAHHLRSSGQVGTPLRPRSYFFGTLPLATRLLPEYVYWGNQVNSQPLALVGSLRHVIGYSIQPGRDSVASLGLAAYATAPVEAAIRSAVNSSDAVALSITPDFGLGGRIDRLNHSIGRPTQRYDVLAKVLHNGTGYLLGTPLYVSLAEADENDGTGKNGA